MNDMNDRCFANLEKAYLEPPEDTRDSPEWEQAKLDLWNERILDVNGYFLEAITERSDEDLAVLAENIKAGAPAEIIGKIVTNWVLEGCKPLDSEVKT